MAVIVNARDIILQSTSPRVATTTVTIDQVAGLGPALKRVTIDASALTFTGKTGPPTPSTITLTIVRHGGITQPAVWSILDGTATVSAAGDVLTIIGSSMTTQSLVVRGRITEDSTNYEAQVSITKLGSVSLSDQINLATQVTNKLANTNVDGLGALALLGSVDLGTTQVVGSLAANRIGVGTLAAGVIYAGSINVTQLVGGTIIGKSLSGGNYLLLGTDSSTTAPVRFFLNTDGVPANGATGRITGSFTAESLSLQNTLVIDNTSSRIVVGASGLINLSSPRSGGGNNTLNISQSGGIIISGGITITGSDIDITGGNINLVGTFGGTLGNRIILKGVVYNTKVNGTPGTKVEFL